MTARDRIAFHLGNNAYVPAMAYASDVVHGQPTPFSLGSPAAESATNIANATITANSAANTAFTLAYTSDSKYGRSLRFTPSGNPGATGGTFDVFGFDYLGQPMVERISGTNGSTSIVYGKKAFGRVTQAKIVTPSTNAITWNIGTGRRLACRTKAMLHGRWRVVFKCRFSNAIRSSPLIALRLKRLLVDHVSCVRRFPASSRRYSAIRVVVAARTIQ
jgi:hypothetical protein